MQAVTKATGNSGYLKWFHLHKKFWYKVKVRSSGAH